MIGLITICTTSMAFDSVEFEMVFVDRCIDRCIDDIVDDGVFDA